MKYTTPVFIPSIQAYLRHQNSYLRFMTSEREAKIERAVQNAQTDLTVVLENVQDPHNIYAVMRSCDSVGIREIYVIDTENKFPVQREMGRRSSASSRKWVKLHYYGEVDACMKQIKSRYTRIFGTADETESMNLYSMDLTQSTALLFGNEHHGVSPEAMSYCTGNFRIPQMGMIQSLNISVACAVSIYEALRQRLGSGAYDKKQPLPELKQEMLKEYLDK